MGRNPPAQARSHAGNNESFIMLIAEAILVSQSEEMGSLICLPLEKFNNILSRIKVVSPEIARKLMNKWKTYAVAHTTIGLKIYEINTKEVKAWNEYIIKCIDHETQLRQHAEDTGLLPQVLRQLLNAIPSKNSAEKLATLIDILFTFKLDAEAFKNTLKTLLQELLPGECIVEKEYPLATGARPDLYLECPQLAIAFEVKSVQEGTATTASHNPLQQLVRYAEILKDLHPGKATAAILVRTDGNTPHEVIAEAARAAINGNIRKRLHILTRSNIHTILRQAKRMIPKGKTLTPHMLLELIAKGRIDTIKLAAK